jgi:hypothetical protein
MFGDALAGGFGLHLRRNGQEVLLRPWRRDATLRLVRELVTANVTAAVFQIQKSDLLELPS